MTKYPIKAGANWPTNKITKIQNGYNCIEIDFLVPPESYYKFPTKDPDGSDPNADVNKCGGIATDLFSNNSARGGFNFKGCNTFLSPNNGTILFASDYNLYAYIHINGKRVAPIKNNQFIGVFKTSNKESEKTTIRIEILNGIAYYSAVQKLIDGTTIIHTLEVAYPANTGLGWIQNIYMGGNHGALHDMVYYMDYRLLKTN